ncbi:hypothetical protein [uncultured Pseudodesulfovibrio sp.]|uniref:hypothetical protein n=1 Tax=uncultured Pseudodesulfovibrio sp. TaxID=2035858 RepID=UPI0029C7EE1D|nr:hypothetical protein [uncultured Pseudodesulfovibrio sp.]
MKRLLVFTLFLLLLILSASPAWTASPSANSMEDLMDSSGYRESIESMMGKHIMVAKTQLMLCDPPLSDDAIDFAVKEMKKEMATIMQTIINSQMNYLAAHMTQSDVNELIGIYHSPIWKKQAAIMKQYQKDKYSELARRLPEQIKEIGARIAFRLKDQGFVHKEAKEQ